MTRPTRPEDIRHPAEVWQAEAERPRYHSDPTPTVRMLGVFLVVVGGVMVAIFAGAAVLIGIWYL